MFLQWVTPFMKSPQMAGFWWLTIPRPFLFFYAVFPRSLHGKRGMAENLCLRGFRKEYPSDAEQRPRIGHDAGVIDAARNVAVSVAVAGRISYRSECNMA